MFPKLIILDRDGVINYNSGIKGSPFYYILKKEHLVFKPNVEKAIDILAVLDVPIILATKQRCISKGSITRKEVDRINFEVADRLGIDFDKIYVEEEAETKDTIYKAIIKDYPGIKPEDMWFFDDSHSERQLAHGTYGITCYDGTDLLQELAFRLGVK